MNTAGRFGSGFLVGALLAGALLFVWSPIGSDSIESPPDTNPTTSTAAVASAPFLERGEVLIDATVLLPRGLEVEAGVVLFQYDVAGLSPSLVEHEDSEYQGEVLILPERWVLTTGSGAVVEETTGPRNHAVAFELPAVDDTVATIELVGWRVSAPLGERIDLPIQKGAGGSFSSGEVVIETVLEQRTSTIVQIDFDRADDGWSNGSPRPLEPGWRVSGRQDGGIQLIWEGDDVPDRLVLEDFGFAMRPAVGSIIVFDARSER